MTREERIKFLQVVCDFNEVYKEKESYKAYLQSAAEHRFIPGQDWEEICRRLQADPSMSDADILEYDLDTTILHWMALVQKDVELTRIGLSFLDRTGHLPGLLADLISRLRLPMETKAEISIAAREHGDLRRKQGYTAAMVVEESRIVAAFPGASNAVQ